MVYIRIQDPNVDFQQMLIEEMEHHEGEMEEQESRDQDERNLSYAKIEELVGRGEKCERSED